MEQPVQAPRLLLGIIGHPLGHSLSPVLHNAMLAKLNIPAAYYAWPMLKERLECFIRSMRTLPIHGASVTIPHKEAVMDHIDTVSELAARTGAVNTLLWRDGRLYGENTDVHGFVAPLESLDFFPRNGLVLGAGGAAKAAVVGMQRLGVKEIFITARSLPKAEKMAEALGCGVIPWEDRAMDPPVLLVNTTPLGMSGKFEKLSAWPDKKYSKGCIAYDLVYNPQETVFLRNAREAGCRIVGGLDMFLHQAARQFSLWTGQRMPLRDARQLVLDALNNGR
jgi:shikimate dehydrogenase